MKLTPHEEKILNIISENPEIINNPALRSKVANKYGLTEKTLRNRIAELKKRGLVNVDKGKVKNNKKPLITENDEKTLTRLAKSNGVSTIERALISSLVY